MPMSKLYDSLYNFLCGMRIQAVLDSATLITNDIASPDNPYFSDENRDDEAIFFFPILGRRRLLRRVYPELDEWPSADPHVGRVGEKPALTRLEESFLGDSLPDP